jgi:hypothetical protein
MGALGSFPVLFPFLVVKKTAETEFSGDFIVFHAGDVNQNGSCYGMLAVDGRDGNIRQPFHVHGNGPLQLPPQQLHKILFPTRCPNGLTLDRRDFLVYDACQRFIPVWRTILLAPLWSPSNS